MPITRNQAPPRAIADPAVEAMGVGLPATAPRPHDPDAVTVHGEVDPETKAALQQGNVDGVFRWTEDDDRGYLGEALDLGASPVKPQEAKAAGVRGGHPRADGFLHRGQNGSLMKFPRAEREARKRKEQAEREGQMKQIRETQVQGMEKEGVPAGAIIGDVSSR